MTIETHTDVEGLEVENDRIKRVRLRRVHEHGHGERFSVECDDVICCAGAWSPEIGRMVGERLG